MSENIFKIMIDNKPYDHENELITGRELKEIGKVDSSYGVWLKVNGPDEDKEINNDESIDLSQPGREHFFTGPKTLTEG